MKRIAIALALTALLLLTACGRVEYTADEAATTPVQTVQEEQPVPQEEKKAQTQVTTTSEPQPQPVTEDEQREQAEVVTTPPQTTEPEKAVVDEPAPQAPAQSEPVQSTPTEYSNVSPEPAQKVSTPAEPAQTSSPEPTTIEPAPTADTYSIDEAMQVGNEYAQRRYGVAIDTGMIAADSGYYPGTVESASWLAANGGQSALNEAVCRNVDATFANLAARDGAETVSAYATFSCTVRYDAAANEYAIVILYG